MQPLILFALVASVAISAHPFRLRDDSPKQLPGGATACPEFNFQGNPTTECVTIQPLSGCRNLKDFVPIKSLKPVEGGACGAYCTKNCTSGSEVLSPAALASTDPKQRNMAGWTSPGFDNPNGLAAEVLSFDCWDCAGKPCWAI